MGTCRRMIVVALGLVLLAPGLPAGEGESPREREAVALFRSPREMGETVQMVELKLDGRTVRGRLVSETEEALHVESPATGTIGYRKKNVGVVRRFELPGTEYAERTGDYYRARVWGEGALDVFAKARRAYRTALELTEDEDARRRLNRKLDDLREQREEWHAEQMRREEAAAAEQEAELARVQRELAEAELQSLRQLQQRSGEQARQIRELSGAVNSLTERLDRTVSFLQEMDRELAYMREEIEDLEHLSRLFVRDRVFLDLRHAHLRLERRVERLQREIDRK